MKKLMQSIKNKNLPGVTSLLLVIAISLALTTIIAGISALSIREIQQASNTDLSNRAYQAAESAVRIVENKLKDDPKFTNSGCGYPDLFSTITANGEQITCLRVTNQFNNYEASIKEDDVAQLQVEGANLANMQLSWGRGTTGGQAYSGELYPEQSGYNNAAGIELTIAYWPNTGNLGSGSIDSKTVFIMPGKSNNPGPVSITSECGTQVVASGYACAASQAELKKLLPTNPNSYNYAIRIKPRYADASIKFVSVDAQGNAINIKSNKAQIDVTAKVGDLYRRVKANVVIAPTAVPNMFDSVLYTAAPNGENSSKNICKNITVKQSDGTLNNPNTCN